MPPTMWERFKTGGKTGFDKTWQALDKLGAPVNKLSNKLGSEAFWPTTLDKESDKAARILRSFCKDGFYGEQEVQPTDGPKMKQRVLQKIPEKVIQNAKGLAIFTTMRTGLWMSGSGGSGVLVARLPDGSWSPPSGILMHTAGLGFMVGVDIYDCVVVINNEKALEAFTKIRCTLGAEISVAAGPVGAGGVLDSELHKRQAPIYTYMKSRGFYAGVQIDGTIVIERMDENERFYNEKIPVKDILGGKVRHPPYELKMLMETLKAAEGNKEYDSNMVPQDAPPSDFEIEHGDMFGVPSKEDPDPYGVLALEKEGMSLKEAGTSKRASWEQFQFNPSPTSPIHSVYARQSVDVRRVSGQSAWRASALSTEPKTPSSLRNSFDRAPVIMADSSTQTDFPLESPTSPTMRSMRSNLSARSSRGSLAQSFHSNMQNVPEGKVIESTEHVPSTSASKANGHLTPPSTPPSLPMVSPVPIEEHDDIPESAQDNLHDDLHDDMQDDMQDDLPDDEVHIVEMPKIQSFQQASPAAAQVISKARLVSVPKRLPPKLPPRNPNRSGPLVIDASPREGKSTESLVASSPSSRNEAATSQAEVKPEEPIAKDLEVISPLAEQMVEIKLDDSAVTTPATDMPHSQTKMPGGFE